MHTYMHAYTHIHIHMRTHIHAYSHTCILTHMHTCTHTHIHICIHTHMDIFIHTLIYTYMTLGLFPSLVCFFLFDNFSFVFLFCFLFLFLVFRWEIFLSIWLYACGYFPTFFPSFACGSFPTCCFVRAGVTVRGVDGYLPTGTSIPICGWGNMPICSWIFLFHKSHLPFLVLMLNAALLMLRFTWSYFLLLFAYPHYFGLKKKWKKKWKWKCPNKWTRNLFKAINKLKLNLTPRFNRSAVPRPFLRTQILGILYEDKHI